MYCIVWNSYSSGKGEYNATSVKFNVDPLTRRLEVSWVAIHKGNKWTDDITTPKAFVTDRIRRLARAVVARRYGVAYWRIV